MIEITSLSKSYGNKKALDNISFSVKKGEVVGFLGPNGAGKSTTMNIITGYLSSTSGTVTVDGFDILDNPKEVKKRVGYLPELPPLYMEMTVEEYLDFVYDLKKVKGKGKEKKEHIASIIAKVGIENVYKRRISNLSKGYKQRVGLAQALIGNPEVLILDEPTVGLDPKQIIEIRNLIKELGEEHTVILSSHILSEISAVCERVIIIKNGKIAAEDTPENLTKRFGANNRMQLKVSGDENAVIDVLSGIEGVISAVKTADGDDDTKDYEIEIEGKIDSDFSKLVFFTLANNNMPILMQNVVKSSLEDVFIDITENDIIEDDTEIPEDSEEEAEVLSEEEALDMSPVEGNEEEEVADDESNI